MFHPTDKKIPMMFMVVLFVLVALTLGSFAETCPSLPNNPCTAEDQKNLKISESSFYAAAAGIMTFVLLMSLFGGMFYKIPFLGGMMKRSMKRMR